MPHTMQPTANNPPPSYSRQDPSRRSTSIHQPSPPTQLSTNVQHHYHHYMHTEPAAPSMLTTRLGDYYFHHQRFPLNLVYIDLDLGPWYLNVQDIARVFVQVSELNPQVLHDDRVRERLFPDPNNPNFPCIESGMLQELARAWHMPNLEELTKFSPKQILDAAWSNANPVIVHLLRSLGITLAIDNSPPTPHHHHLDPSIPSSNRNLPSRPPSSQQLMSPQSSSFSSHPNRPSDPKSEHHHSSHDPAAASYHSQPIVPSSAAPTASNPTGHSTSSSINPASSSLNGPPPSSNLPVNQGSSSGRFGPPPIGVFDHLNGNVRNRPRNASMSDVTSLRVNKWPRYDEMSGPGAGSHPPNASGTYGYPPTGPVPGIVVNTSHTAPHPDSTNYNAGDAAGESPGGYMKGPNAAVSNNDRIPVMARRLSVGNAAMAMSSSQQLEVQKLYHQQQQIVAQRIRSDSISTSTVNGATYPGRSDLPPQPDTYSSTGGAPAAGPHPSQLTARRSSVPSAATAARPAARSGRLSFTGYSNGSEGPDPFNSTHDTLSSPESVSSVRTQLLDAVASIFDTLVGLAITAGTHRQQPPPANSVTSHQLGQALSAISELHSRVLVLERSNVVAAAATSPPPTAGWAQQSSHTVPPTSQPLAASTSNAQVTTSYATPVAELSPPAKTSSINSHSNAVSSLPNADAAVPQSYHSSPRETEPAHLPCSNSGAEMDQEAGQYEAGNGTVFPHPRAATPVGADSDMSYVDDQRSAPPAINGPVSDDCKVEEMQE